MRILPICFLFSTMLNAQESVETVSVDTAVERILDAYDHLGASGPLPQPRVRKADEDRLQWLLSALRDPAPTNPFPRGTSEYREAESVRSFLKSTGMPQARTLDSFKASLAGSWAALWRWGKERVRQGTLPPSLRHPWEDKLLEGGPALVQGFTLRHALCFALSERDLTRFGNLKSRWAEDAPEFFTLFQRAFSMLDEPCPVLRLWRLPELEALEGPLPLFGSRRLRIAREPSAASAQMAWAIPTLNGVMPSNQADLDPESRREGEEWAGRFPDYDSHIYLAPSRQDMETLGLCIFPVELEFEEGRVRSIRMGDAALAGSR